MVNNLCNSWAAFNWLNNDARWVSWDSLTLCSVGENSNTAHVRLVSLMLRERHHLGRRSPEMWREFWREPGVRMWLQGSHARRLHTTASPPIPAWLHAFSGFFFSRQQVLDGLVSCVCQQPSISQTVTSPSVRVTVFDSRHIFFLMMMMMMMMRAREKKAPAFRLTLMFHRRLLYWPWLVFNCRNLVVFSLQRVLWRAYFLFPLVNASLFVCVSLI